jgi:hypothetical protein
MRGMIAAWRLFSKAVPERVAGFFGSSPERRFSMFPRRHIEAPRPLSCGRDLPLVLRVSERRTFFRSPVGLVVHCRQGSRGVLYPHILTRTSQTRLLGSAAFALAALCPN